MWASSFFLMRGVTLRHDVVLRRHQASTSMRLWPRQSLLCHCSDQAPPTSSLLQHCVIESADHEKSLSIYSCARRYGSIHPRSKTDDQVKFTHGRDYSLFLTSHEAVLSLTKPDIRKASAAGFNKSKTTDNNPKTDVLRMQFAGIQAGVQVFGEERLPGIANYFIGNDATKWHANIPTYAKVRYAGVYPGVDLVYYGNQQQLEYDFVVAPGADPKQINLADLGSLRSPALGSCPSR
jgi:hypothetical protein